MELKVTIFISIYEYSFSCDNNTEQKNEIVYHNKWEQSNESAIISFAYMK